MCIHIFTIYICMMCIMHIVIVIELGRFLWLQQCISSFYLTRPWLAFAVQKCVETEQETDKSFEYKKCLETGKQQNPCHTFHIQGNQQKQKYSLSMKSVWKQEEQQNNNFKGILSFSCFQTLLNVQKQENEKILCDAKTVTRRGHRTNTESVSKQENNQILCDAKPLLTERPFRCLDVP